MFSSRFGRGSGFGTRARATMACSETFLPGTLLLCVVVAGYCRRRPVLRSCTQGQVGPRPSQPS
eukprot:391921-Prymnesium_polylepis.1